jgi:hypothetical protein
MAVQVRGKGILGGSVAVGVSDFHVDAPFVFVSVHGD